MTTLIPVAVSPLRQCLIEEVEVRRFGHDTQRNYIRDVGRFANVAGAVARYSDDGRGAALPGGAARPDRVGADHD